MADLGVREETMIINMGPQHPSTHGVLRLVLELDGEYVVSCRPVIGYLHTGIEKNTEYRTWQQGVTFVTRADYLSPFFNEVAYCLAVERLLGIIESEERAVLFTVVEGEPLGAELLVTEAGETLGPGPAELAGLVDELLRKGRNTLLELDEGQKVFAEIYGPAPRLLVIGAVDTAEALCAAAKQLGWHTIVADARAKFATKERIPSADELLVAWPQDAIEQVQPDYQTAVVVLTHDDKFDVPAIQGALATEAFYIGALGSRRNQERRRERLLEAGVEEQALARVSGPTGLDIGADTPAETALSILGEILATRAGRDGGFLRDSKTRIHVEEPQEKGVRRLDNVR